MRKRTIFTTVISTFIIIFWALFLPSLFTGHKLIKRAIKSKERTVFVECANLQDQPGINVLDANNPYFQILRSEPNRVDVAWKGKNIIHLKESTCRVQKLNSQIVHVTAKFKNKQYPVVIDSGFGKYLMVNDVVIIENELDIFPVETKDQTVAGLCHVDKIEIGDMTITNPACFYTNGHYEIRLLGRTRWKQRQIILGLELMRQFKYILIDNIASEVEFSTKKSFAADPNESWLQYPMWVGRDEKNVQEVVVEIQIAGKVRQVEFDTGASANLLVSQSIWKKISEALEEVETSEGRAQMIYGWEDVSIKTVRELDIGERTLSNTTIAVLKDESRKGSDFFLLGMGYFKDTAIVLDFENNLLWIKRTSNLPANSETQS